LRRRELPRDTVALARFLLGTVVVSEATPARTAARIVEVEAYLADDPAAHSFRGETARNRTLFMQRGHAYVYFIYGTSFCLNVSSEVAGVGAGVLLRAAEPLLGSDVMLTRRPGASDRDLCRGPGRLARALGLDRSFDGLDLTVPGPLRLAALPGPHFEIGAGPRIGLTKEAERVLRFYERGSPFLSGTKARNR
jgi:DNA-3-methyladenine glycosylase